jgi:hypothetical protein
MLHPIIKSCPFCGWGLDFIGKIHPPSSKEHRFVLVATDYFTKWTEVVPLKNITHKEVIEFITEHIIHRFGIPQTLTIDQGTSFMSEEVRDFAELYKIKLLKSSPYYAQANGQAESSNKTLIKLIKKKIEENPRRWHEVLSEALWAHRISRHGAIKVTPFELVYGQEAMLPIEVNLDAYRLAKQNDLSAVVDEEQSFGKWSPNWGGPYKVIKVMSGNSYLLETLQGECLKVAFNRRYVKTYFPSVWQEA